MDRKVIEIMIGSFSGGPVGIESWAASIGEDKDTIEEVYEPFLIQKGYVRRTPRGRQVCAKGYKALNLQPQAKQMENMRR
jgi:Holliday junction DNA helicase RuvB